jgi:SAM-dependent methyltransferase
MNQSPISVFQSDHYQRHNQKRLEHLASLGLDLSHKTVLEVGAGIGDHTGFFLERNCKVTSVEARPENLEILKQRHPEVAAYCLDLDQPDLNFDQPFDIVYCYGLLYHLQRPAEAIEFMARYCRNLLLLETCVSLGDEEQLNPCEEPASDPTQSFNALGCRPTRRWVLNRLKQHFDFVYLPTTQPDHEEFPTDWTQSVAESSYTRSIFIASRFPIKNSLLIEHLPEQQRRYSGD